MQGRSSRNWKTLLVDPFKQVKLGVYVVLWALCFVVITASVFVYAFWQQYQQIMEIFRITDQGLRTQLLTNDVFIDNVFLLSGILFFFLASLLILLFRVTHKYYGPLVAIERFVEGVTEGDYHRRVVVRRNDELQTLVRKLNAMAVVLEERHGLPKVSEHSKPSEDEA